MEIGQRIKQIRKEKHVSAETLAERLGVSAPTVYRWENGAINKVPTDTLVKIAEVLNTTPEYLMGWSEKEKKAPRSADLDDDDVLLTYQGKPLSESDRELIKRIMRGKNE